MNKIIIRKVWKAKKQNQLIITIPKDKGIEDGDYVELKRVDLNES